MFEPSNMWTKLKEKSETIFSSAGWNPSHLEPSQGIQEKEKSSTGLAVVAGQQHMQVHTPRLMYSEASVSMLVECFSA
ncbi:hypothetical protein AAZX31_07G152300 [Glycine max]|uniref:Uncharacterized protein n=2 Tax=Glycine subgen. Soja TaxID=1462606 RepID=A0A0R0JAA5_SOYBN|nr:uncharacterized protein LOC113002191 [Glycine max]KHN45315.1 hypothetical protein glysoja_047888 [Glycine soja]KAG5022901.1 hypothetical protein JHK85_019243 [Glycine max]KAG5037979.1 hypothetical protein JHK86_018819 [Glycine max]KAG5143106.1 hypothetical protein JHK82_018801 [Glycine max]KAH1087145.1 hypothetical protein GYH30_018610 [Glycine max]|eukprot:XP_025985072.1 uncharacterized protein LOC113002191 [Glycine max]